MKCTHDDCLTCPYPDCISAKGPANRVKQKRGRKKLDPEERIQRRRESGKRYYYRNREKRLAHAKEYARSHAEELRQRSRENRAKHPNDALTFDSLVWITNGKDNKRIRLSRLEEYLTNGWYRGRTLAPYKYREENDLWQ